MTRLTYTLLAVLCISACSFEEAGAINAEIYAVNGEVSEYVDDRAFRRDMAAPDVTLSGVFGGYAVSSAAAVETRVRGRYTMVTIYAHSLDRTRVVMAMLTLRDLEETPLSTTPIGYVSYDYGELRVTGCEGAEYGEWDTDLNAESAVVYLEKHNGKTYVNFAASFLHLGNLSGYYMQTEHE